MKKFTALMLVVLMVVALVPFSASAATTWTKVDTAAEFAAMTDGNYWLTADITLPADWTAKDFAGTLNGNGKTITVSSGAPVFDTVTGTIKNVGLKGDVALDSADASDMYIPGDINGYAVGVLANVVIGGTIDNIDANVNATFTNTVPATKPQGGDACFTFGLIGYATAEFKIEKVVEGETTKNVLTVGEKTTINDVVVDGTIKADFVTGRNREDMGIIVGTLMGGVTVSKCVANATAVCGNSGGNKGGIVGHVNDSFTIVNPDDATKTIGVENSDYINVITDCLFSGKWTTEGKTGERFGGIVGYARGVKITKCAVTAEIGGAGNLFGVWGYANANGTTVYNELSETIFVGKIGDKAAGAGANISYTRLTKAGATLIVKDVYRVGTDVINAPDETQQGKPQMTGVSKDYADAAAAIAAFAAANNTFEVKDGALVLKATAFTPAADPADPAPAPTGDMTIALVAVAVVSLAAVTVIAKKKVND